MNCPKCGQDMEHMEGDPSYDLPEGWFCFECDLFMGYLEADDSSDRYQYRDKA